ncbi:MAG: hypothetical protein WC856_25970, partial [Methylococcaceae bacterium]
MAAPPKIATVHPAEARTAFVGRLLPVAAVSSRPKDRGRERLSPSPPSEPGVRFSRDGLSSQLFPHRDWRANLWASD